MELQNPFETVLAEALAARDRSPRTQDTYVWMLRLHRDWDIKRMPYQKKRRTLPEILAPEEVTAILDACTNLKRRALLMTSYSGGLRLSETLGLVPGDIDSKRMMIRIEQGKGRKDRYVMLSPVLLQTLREYWKEYRPVRWLF